MLANGLIGKAMPAARIGRKLRKKGDNVPVFFVGAEDDGSFHVWDCVMGEQASRVAGLVTLRHEPEGRRVLEREAVELAVS